MHFNKKKIAEVCAKALLAGGVATAGSVLAATAAGTLIKNLATVTYEDVNGNKYSAQSNEAVITVKQVYSAELGEDTAKNAAAGQTVYSAHALTNTGNGEDTYTISTADAGGVVAADSVNIYHDVNGNGIADAGEPLIASAGTDGSVTLAGGETLELVMAVGVPNTAVPTDTVITMVTATSSNGDVIDLTTSGGYDGDSTADADATNHTVITVTNDAVLNVSKSAILDPATNQITYTVTVTNTGNQAARDVLIFDGLPAGTTFVSASSSGLLTTNGDTLPDAAAATALSEAGLSASLAPATIDLNADGDITDIDEATLGLDLDSNGTIDATAVSGMFAIDSELQPGSTVSATMVVAYDPATFDNGGEAGSAGDVIKNTAFVTADKNGSGSPQPPEPSNPTQTTLPMTYGVSADDTGENVGAGDLSNDGLDDDALNDVQFVAVAPSGSEVLFNVDVTNNGTGADTFELTIANTDFPPGTTFTFWNRAGTVQLIDTNSIGSVDTGLLDPNETLQLLVKAKLPAGTNDAANDAAGDGYNATLTATSATAPNTVAVADRVDTMSLKLGSISAPGVDLREPGLAPTGDNDDDIGDASNINMGAFPGTRGAFVGTIGGTVNIPFAIDNNSGASDSFQLFAGSSYDGSNVGSLPTGWTVKFYKGDGSGNPTGSAITNTALMPGGAIGQEYVAVVTIPNDPAYALADYGTMDANGDGDGDQPIFIQIASSNSGSTDIMVDAIDMESVRSVILTPPGSNQIQPGGSANYVNTLENAGNTEETMELSASNSGTGWNNVITVPVDTTGDGVADADMTLAELDALIKSGGTPAIIGVDAGGNPISITVTDNDGDSSLEVTMPPGTKIELTPTVFSPSNAAPGETDILTIDAVAVDPTTGADDTSAGAPVATVDDVTSVILGQVRLSKTVAHDADCNGTADSAFEASLTAQIAPNECAIWQIQAENQGDADARNVVINDEVPAFTTFEAGSLRYALGNGATLTTVTDAVGDDQGEHDAGAITFYVGLTDADAIPGGTLEPGQITTVQFSTRIE